MRISNLINHQIRNILAEKTIRFIFQSIPRNSCQECISWSHQQIKMSKLLYETAEQKWMQLESHIGQLFKIVLCNCDSRAVNFTKVAFACYWIQAVSYD